MEVVEVEEDGGTADDELDDDDILWDPDFFFQSLTGAPLSNFKISSNHGFAPRAESAGVALINCLTTGVSAFPSPPPPVSRRGVVPSQHYRSGERPFDRGRERSANFDPMRPRRSNHLVEMQS